MNGSNWLSATLAIVWHSDIVSVLIGLRTDTTGVFYKAYINNQNQNIFTIKEINDMKYLLTILSCCPKNLWGKYNGLQL